MRLLLFITVIALMAALAGCGSTRKTRTAQTEPAPADVPDAPSPAEADHEVAPFGNAALAGKPAEEQEADTHVWDFRDATTWLLGDFLPARLLDPPHSSWYVSGMSDYQPDPAIMQELKETDIGNLTVTIVLGTWCPDSRREVPRFMKVLDLIGFPSAKVTFIGVDNSKQAPVGDYDKLEIERVPTFIFLRNKVEAGRIIENPVTSLEQDMLNILTRNE